MREIKALLWLLEPYIVYRAYWWSVRFRNKPYDWDGSFDLFAFTLALALWADVIVLPVVIWLLPGPDGESSGGDKPVMPAPDPDVSALSLTDKRFWLDLWYGDEPMAGVLVKRGRRYIRRWTAGRHARNMAAKRWVYDRLGRLRGWINRNKTGSFMDPAFNMILAFLYYLIPVYVGAQLVMAVIMALLYDMLLWASGI